MQGFARFALRVVAFVLVILVAAEVYLYFDPQLQNVPIDDATRKTVTTYLQPMYFVAAVGIGLVLIALTAVLSRKMERGEKTEKPLRGHDWYNIVEPNERFTERLWYDMREDPPIKVSVRRAKHIFVEIDGGAYDGSYVMPLSSNLMKIAPEHLEEYRVSQIVDEIPIPVGIEDLDKLTGGGTHKGDVNVIAGSAASGKTTCLIAMIHAAVKAGKKCAVFHGHYSRPTFLQLMRAWAGTEFDTSDIFSMQFTGASTNALEERILGKYFDLAFIDGMDMMDNKVGPVTNVSDRLVAVVGDVGTLANVRGVSVWATVSTRRGRIPIESLPDEVANLAASVFHVSLGAGQSIVMSPAASKRWAFSEGESVKIERLKTTA